MDDRCAEKSNCPQRFAHLIAALGVSLFFQSSHTTVPLPGAARILRAKPPAPKDSASTKVSWAAHGTCKNSPFITVSSPCSSNTQRLTLYHCFLALLVEPKNSTFTSVSSPCSSSPETHPLPMFPGLPRSSNQELGSLQYFAARPSSTQKLIRYQCVVAELIEPSENSLFTNASPPAYRAHKNSLFTNALGWTADTLPPKTSTLLYSYLPVFGTRPDHSAVWWSLPVVLASES
jgi:hypothetical protein